MKRFMFMLVFIAVGTILVFGSACQNSQQKKVDSIDVAYSPFEHNVLLWIAQDQDFFSQNGLKVTMRKYDTGAGSVDGVLNGEEDIAVGATEYPVVGRAFLKEKIRIIASLSKVEQIYVVARKDRIEKISDLKGKKVGTTIGTIAHFYLGRFLELNGINIKDIDLVDVKTPQGWANAVANGEIDAISTAQPYANQAKERLGDNGAIWPAQGDQLLFGLIISTDTWIKKNPELANKFLKALAQAEEYLISHKDKGRAILQKQLKLDAANMKRIWSEDQFALSLDQSLIAAMEDEARWMIKNKLTDEEQIPDFLDYVNESNLKSVKSESVDIIR